jgi:hypothetical protein
MSCSALRLPVTFDVIWCPTGVRKTFSLALFVQTTLLGCAFCRPAAAAGPQVEVIEPPTRDTDNNTGPTSPSRVLPGEPPQRKNYLIPALEIPLFQLLLNGADRLIYPHTDYETNLDTGWNHLNHGPWVVDQDAFTVNQIGHPYQGAMYYGFARSAGLNFWEGMLYSNAGSAIWELWGETTDPSINDQVASGTAGALIGEPLMRMSDLVLERGGEKPSVKRRIASALVSPSVGFNRLLFGDRFAPVVQRDPQTLTRVQLGGGVNETVRNPGSAGTIAHHVGTAEFSMAYGLPGKPGYRYLRPFDYFDFQVSALAENRSRFYNLSTRGLLFGKKYEAGPNYRGIWGLYGSFDYLSPEVFRVSNTAASIGTTGQWWMSRHIALQGSTLAGVGYAAAGTIIPEADDRDYHYGLAPQGLIALRLILGRRTMLDSTLREYYITGTGAGRGHGTERLTRLETGILVRLFGCHALGLHYVLSRRDVDDAGGGLTARHQKIGTIVLAYNLLGNPRFGAVDWRGK